MLNNSQTSPVARITKQVIVSAAVLLTTLPAAHLANATDSTQNPSQAYQTRFDAMLADPANPELSFQFAKEAIRGGDLKGAIAAFERILKINPGLNNIRLELGVLYLRVGANELAAKYINDALQAPDIPVPVKNRAKSLYKLAQDAASPHALSFRIGLGAHYDENATAAPDSREVLVGGLPALLDEEDTGEHDSSYSLSASLQHAYTFSDQSGSLFETNLSYYSRRYDESSEIDLDYLSLQLGPRFYLGPVLSPSWSVNPFLAATVLELDGEEYQESYDAGLNIQHYFGTSWMAGITARYSDHTYKDSEQRANASERSGDGYSADIKLMKTFVPSVQGYITVGMSERNAEEDYEARQEVASTIGIQKSYLAPFGLQQRWKTGLAFSYTDISYDAPDPAVDPDEKREDERAQVRWTNSFVFTRSFYTTFDVFHTDNTSSLPNYEYDNTGANLTFWFAF